MYECHVTIEPVFTKTRMDELGVICYKHGFMIAKLFMQKREEDTLERSKYDTFVTGHRHDFEQMKLRMTELIEECKASGFKVWRYKIEEIVLDSRKSDELELLEG
jgi:UDP-2,3-diacylglucosamine pyrophosphatase LpxH